MQSIVKEDAYEFVLMCVSFSIVFGRVLIVFVCANASQAFEMPFRIRFICTRGIIDETEPIL